MSQPIYEPQRPPPPKPEIQPFPEVRPEPSPDRPSPIPPPSTPWHQDPWRQPSIPEVPEPLGPIHGSHACGDRS